MGEGGIKNGQKIPTFMDGPLKTVKNKKVNAECQEKKFKFDVGEIIYTSVSFTKPHLYKYI